MLMDSYLKKVAVDALLESYSFDREKKLYMALIYTIS